MMIDSPIKKEFGGGKDSFSMGKRVKKKQPATVGNESTKKQLQGQINSQVASTMSKITPLRVIVATIMLGVFGYFYISHVFYMQQLHSEVMQLRTQYEQVKIDHLNAQLSFERLTGPADIYSRAREMGLVDAGPADRIITPLK
jgi:ABC-type bacteriocin/lantibiotic exporter with double-glycine peptidase domain